MMDDPAVGSGDAASERPVGLLQPSSPALARVAEALERGRIDEAQKLLRAARHEQEPEGAAAGVWWTLLCGQLALDGGRIGEALSLLSQAHEALPAEPTDEIPTVGHDDIRLKARTLVLLGRALRRQDRVDDARRVHLAARTLSERYGSAEEIWEVENELGLDADVAGQHAEGQGWHRAAIKTAERCRTDSLIRQATSWMNLSSSLSGAIQEGEAADAARTSCELWRRYDPGDARVALAEKRHGEALLRHGEQLIDIHDPRAPALLAEAVDRLVRVADELAAFGPICGSAVQSCRDQVDLAERLLAAAGVSAPP
jgi:tetratricopeptide (TPR) repeat protein